MISKPSRLALSGLAFGCAAFLAACGNSSPTVKSVAIAPTNGNIYVSAKPAGGVKGAARDQVRPAQEGAGNTTRQPEITINPVTASCKPLQYAATGLLSNGKTQDLTSTATWTSSNTAVATISSAGLATGVGPGMTNIGASYKAVSGMTEPLAVDQLNSISVSPSPASQPLGASQPFKAIGSFTFAAGNSGSLDVSSQVTWKSSNTAVATIDSTGNATTVGQGMTNITATSCDGVIVSPPATLTVGPAVATSLVVAPVMITISAGTTTLFTAMEMFSDRTTHPATGVTWASDTTSVATIDPNSGVALGVTARTSAITITATESTSGLTGTASLTVKAATARFAYIANIQGNGTGGGLGSGSISAYTVDVTQSTPVNQMTGSPFSASNPQQVLLHPSGDLMYYINSSSKIVTNFVDSVAGGLTFSNRTVSTAGAGGVNVGVIDPLGRFIYVIDDGSNASAPTPTIYGYSIAQTQTQSTNGVLTAIPGLTAYTDATLSAPTWVMTDRAGKFLYVVNSGGNSISEYSVNPSTGGLTLLSATPVPAGAAPFFATTDIKGHIYVANTGDGTVSVFTIDSNTGLLTQVGSSNFTVTGANTVFNVLPDPTGKYLYVLDSPGTTAGQVFAFNLDQTTGAITTAIGTPPATGIGSIGMAIDPTGVLLAVDNNADNTISLYNVSTSTGALTVASPATVATDQIPQFVVFYTAASGQ